MKYIKLEKYVEMSSKYKKELKELLNKTNLNEKEKDDAYAILTMRDEFIDYMDSLKEMYSEKAEEHNKLAHEFNDSLDASKRKILYDKTKKITKELEKMRTAYLDLKELVGSLYPIASNLQAQIESIEKNNKIR